MEIKGKVTLITGASRGLGVDMADEFGKRGARLALAARSKSELEAVRDQLSSRGVEVIAVPTDVSDLGSLEKLVAAVEEKLGPIDILVNNAGIESVEDFEKSGIEESLQIIDVNVKGLIALTRLVLPSMVERRTGQIVNIASMAGLLPVPHNSVYSASKHAIVGFSRSLRLEMAEFGVGVSVVCPGFVDGGMFAQWGRPAPASAGSVSPLRVALATVEAATRNTPEIKVNSALGKSAPTIHAISPKFSGWLIERLGVAKFLRDQAQVNGAKKQNETIRLQEPAKAPAKSRS
jgi:short-subunit dehydrogenase